MLLSLLGLMCLARACLGIRTVEVEDVTARQFQAAINTEEHIAVYWCKFVDKFARLKF